LSPLAPWMKRLLWFVGGYNLLAGLGMLVFVHEGYKLIGLVKPDLVMPVQLVGILVALFGIGYWMVAADPLLNRNVLLLGLLSKALGATLSLVYVAMGRLPWTFVPVLFISDIVYLPPFYVILRRLYAVAANERQNSRTSQDR
jgi:hypothetical protein